MNTIGKTSALLLLGCSLQMYGMETTKRPNRQNQQIESYYILFKKNINNPYLLAFVATSAAWGLYEFRNMYVGNELQSFKLLNSTCKFARNYIKPILNYENMKTAVAWCGISGGLYTLYSKFTVTNSKKRLNNLNRERLINDIQDLQLQIKTIKILSERTNTNFSIDFTAEYRKMTKEQNN